MDQDIDNSATDEEPDFGPSDDPAADEERLRQLNNKNRLRVIIPLFCVILLTYLLSFFGDPFAPKDENEESANPTQETKP